jgi:hypothetical protein
MAHAVEKSSIIIIECKDKQAWNVNLYIFLSNFRSLLWLSKELKEAIDIDE